MAVASIAVPADAQRDARARELAPFVGTWPKHTLKIASGAFEAGTVFRRATGSNGERYLVNAVACECADYQRSGQVCKHVRAVVLWEQQQAAPTVAPKARRSYEDLYPACAGGCGELVERPGEDCYLCGPARERRQRLAERRAVLANE